MQGADGSEWSPIVASYQALQARQPGWYVEIGMPQGPGWIRGTELQTASEGPFNHLLVRIGAMLHTTDRRTIAAAFALRFGWSAAMAIAPYMFAHCVPTITLDNVSFKFQDNTFFERVALHRPAGVMLPQNGAVPHPLIQWLPSHEALRAWLRRSLVQQAETVVESLYAWSRFSMKGLWGMITSSWGSQFITIGAQLEVQQNGLQSVLPFFAGNDVVAQMQPRFYPVTYDAVTHLYHCRATCCRYYLLPQGHYCASCPLISQAERVRRNQLWMQRLPGSSEPA